jgi:calcineurin-like phosphoesterase family protein/purple acid phosphatase-like protein
MRHSLQKINLIALFSLFFVLLTANPLSEEQIKIEHGPYLVEPGENTMTVMWFTNKNCVSWVEYCGDDNFGTFPIWGGYPEIAQNSHHGLIDANTKMHSIKITGLEAGKKYRYRIVSREILQFDPYEVLYGDTVVGEVFEFETLSQDKKQFSFGVIADVHERAKKLDTLLQSTSLDALDFIFFNGDALNWIGEEERIFSGLLDVSVDHFAKEKPLIFLRGNHETRGPNARKLFPYLPGLNGKYYYSFSQGNVHFVLLDAGEDKPDNHPVYGGLVDFDAYRIEQTEWLKQEVQTKEFNSAMYRVVLIHIPPYTDSKNHGATDITQKWGPILNDANIDLMINGHEHRYCRYEKRKGKNRFPIFVLGQDMFLTTDVSEKNLSITVKDHKGELVDSYIIKSEKK